MNSPLDGSQTVQGSVHIVSNGLQPTTNDDDDDDDDHAESNEEEEEEALTLWSLSPLKMMARQALQFKGEAGKGQAQVLASIDEGCVTVVAPSVTLTADGTITCKKGAKGTTTVSELCLMHQQGSDDEDDADEGAVTISYVAASGSKKVQVRSDGPVATHFEFLSLTVGWRSQGAC